MTSYIFRKDEKLCSQKIIGEMFLTGNPFLCYPLKALWLNLAEISTPYAAKTAFAVSKKNFKRAHDRNRIRRMMRESYRYLKSILYKFLELNGQKIALMIIYVGKGEPEFHQVESAMTKVIYRLEQEIKTGIKKRR